MKNKKPPTIRPADAVKDAAAELRFQEWLTASEVAHLYIEQSPLTMPTHLRGKFKRVDNLVGITGVVGLVAFDVKAKTVYHGELIFDLDEVKKLRRFARQFHLTVFFACLDPEGGTGSFGCGSTSWTSPALLPVSTSPQSPARSIARCSLIWHSASPTLSLTP